VVRIPVVVPQTLGDHIRKRRLGLKMLQKDVAEQLGVDKTSIFNWESNTSTPAVRYMPAIIDFLGHDPRPQPNTVAGRLIRQRTSQGLSQKEAAGRIGVGPGTLARWERGEREPSGEFLLRLNQFLQDARQSGERRAG
jgi:transcriptional regulator with XRE-family HTH domain